MKASFQKIDYSLRPAKHAERRMICDIFRRLKPFGPVEDYVYVGFGSLWFADFSLFHRALGVKEMISIEEKESARERIEENKPFRIQVEYKKSHDVLPNLNWERKHFFWFDYDEPLSLEILRDVSTVAQRAISGTVLAVSVQCHRATQIEEVKKLNQSDSLNAIDLFVNLFGRERIAQGVDETSLYGWPFAELSREIILNEIRSILAIRNSGDRKMSISLKKICEIEYADDAKMTTIIVIFYSEDDSSYLQDCKFESLDFLCGNDKTLRIAVPKLTPREFKRLESQVPLPVGEELSLGTIPVSEGRDFASMYRYLPNFAVLEG